MRFFQWNIFNKCILEQCCFDIDGVLCPDPTEQENDDNQKYVYFIQNVCSNFESNYPLGHIVSSRLEKYRNQTEKWLRCHHFVFQKLILLNLPDKAARIRWNKRAEYKAKHYQRFGDLFFESDLTQAIKIVKISQKPVFCTQNMSLLFPVKKRTKPICYPRYISIWKNFLICIYENGVFYTIIHLIKKIKLFFKKKDKSN